MLVVVNLTLEPASFITANALTTLCGDSLSSQNVAQIGVSVRAAVLFCLLLTLPIGGLLLATPALLSLLTVSRNDVLGHAAEYAPAYVLVITPALLLSVLLGFLRAHGRLRSTVTGTPTARGMILRSCATEPFLLPPTRRALCARSLL